MKKGALFVFFALLFAFFLKPSPRFIGSEGEEIISQPLAESVRQLYDRGLCGKISFVPGKGHKIAWHPPRSKETLCPKESKGGSAVTYGLSGGRLGDNLLAYLHAKWISYHEQRPLIHKPFPHDQEFALIYDAQATFDGPIVEIPYFPEPSMKNQNPPFVVDWEDPGFRKEIARSLAPTRPPHLLPLPPGRIAICVHIRRGGAFDPPSLHLEYPLKFPPDSYYQEQIKTATHIFKGKPLYVFLMTDDLNPKQLLERYRKAIPLPNIEWDCRKEPPANDLDDFFSIPTFDCLILCDSNFSIAASKLSEFALRIAPTHYQKKKGKVRITGVEISFNPFYSDLNLH